jgi:hypothetical protein
VSQHVDRAGALVDDVVVVDVHLSRKGSTTNPSR